MAAEFNVQVLATLRSRVAQGLRLISRGAYDAQRGITALQRSLNDLQTRHAMYAQRLRTTQSLERSGTADLQRRLAATQQLAASEQALQMERINSMKAESAERSRMGRIQAEQLGGLKRRTALQKVSAREQADAQSVQLAEQRMAASAQARQIQMSELQGRINRRNAIAKMRDTEGENRLLREQNAIRDRQAAITAEQAAARRARIGHAFGMVGGAVLIAGAAAAEAAKAGLPVGMYLQQIRQGAPLTAAQSAMLPQMALQLSSQSTQFTYKEVLRALRTLIPRFGFQAVQRSAPSLFALGALERERGISTGLGEMSVGTMQTMRTLRARTPAQQSAVINALTSMLFQAGVSPESFNATLRTTGIATTTLPFQQRLRAGVLTQMVMALGGSQEGLSGTGIGNLFKALLMPRLGAHMGLIQLLNTHHLPLTGPNALSNILTVISQAPRSLTLPERFLAGSEFHTLVALRNQLHGGLLGRVQAALSQRVNPQELLATSLTTAQPAMKRLATSLDNFVTVIGARMGGPLASWANWAARAYSSAAQGIQQQGFFPWLGGETGSLLDLSRPGRVQLTPRLTIPERLGNFGIPFFSHPGTAGQPIHVTVELDGKKVGEAVVHHMRPHLKQSAKTMSQARGSVAHPKLFPGR